MSVFVVADMSANHLQDFNRAKEIIDSAKLAGVDAIKTQTGSFDCLRLGKRKAFFEDEDCVWFGKDLKKFFGELFMPHSWNLPLKKYANSLGLLYFSTPFDVGSVKCLEKIDVPFYKISSFEIDNFELLKAVGRTKKPVLLSTGLATFEDIEKAVGVLKSFGCWNLTLLHCVSEYPARFDLIDLENKINKLKSFGLPVGFSDHSLGFKAAVVAVRCGVCVVEKHLTLKRSDGGSDSVFSSEPEEFTELVKRIRMEEKQMMARWKE